MIANRIAQSDSAPDSRVERYSAVPPVYDVSYRIDFVNRLIARAYAAEMAPAEPSRSSEQISTLKANRRLDASALELPNGAPARRRTSLEALAEWEGYIVGISENEFEAELVDVRNIDPSEVITTKFSKSEVSEPDLSLLQLGAIFQWVIGYELADTGTKRRVSELVFRRLPAWRWKDVQDIYAEAEKLHDGLIVE